MSESQVITFRLNLDDSKDKLLYDKLQEASLQYSSQSQYIKDSLREYLVMKENKSGFQRWLDDTTDQFYAFQDEIKETIKNEIKEQALLVVMAALGQGTIGNVELSAPKHADEEKLPEVSDSMPEGTSNFLLSLM